MVQTIRNFILMILPDNQQIASSCLLAMTTLLWTGEREGRQLRRLLPFPYYLPSKIVIAILFYSTSRSPAFSGIDGKTKKQSVELLQKCSLETSGPTYIKPGIHKPILREKVLKRNF